ncbi:hypothetical protein [Thomasclavelia sp.]
MNKITICRGNNKTNIIIDKYKLIIGNNYIYHDNLFKNIKLFFSNIKNEYRQEHEKEVLIYIDDKLLNRKRSILFNINKNFSFNKDLKMQTDSLVAKYLEIVINKPELIDTINTINYLLETFCEQINEISIIKTNYNVMTEKKLTKLIEPYVDIEGYKCDEYDLTYEEIIIIQLKLIKEIINNNQKYDYIFIILEIPYLSRKILDAISCLSNCFLFICINSYNFIKNISLSDILLLENKVVDFANEEQVCEIICNNCYKPIYLYEVEEYMKEYFINSGSEKCSFIRKLLNK